MSDRNEDGIDEAKLAKVEALLSGRTRPGDPKPSGSSIAQLQKKLAIEAFLDPEEVKRKKTRSRNEGRVVVYLDPDEKDDLTWFLAREMGIKSLSEFFKRAANTIFAEAGFDMHLSHSQPGENLKQMHRRQQQVADEPIEEPNYIRMFRDWVESQQEQQPPPADALNELANREKKTG